MIGIEVVISNCLDVQPNSSCERRDLLVLSRKLSQAFCVESNIVAVGCIMCGIELTASLNFLLFH